MLNSKGICIPPKPYEGDYRPVGMRLWVDDEREPDHTWTWAKTSAGAIYLLAHQRVRDMSLDHDLGGEDTTRAVIMWLCMRQALGDDRWPDVVDVHSLNSVGAEWLIGMCQRYSPDECVVRRVPFALHK